MGKGRAPCCDKSKVKRGPWSPAEDLRLITFIQKHGHDNWRAIPKLAENITRNVTQLTVLKSNISIKSYGSGTMLSVETVDVRICVGEGLLRCGKSCRLRWINYLRPDLKRGNFTVEEEEAIIKLHQSIGNKWSKIASHFPGRTDNEIKNVWNTHLKKKRLSLDHDSINQESCITSSSSSPSSSSISGKKMEEQMDLGLTIQKEQTQSISINFEDPCDVHSNKFEEVNKPEMFKVPFELENDFWNLLDNIGSSFESSNPNEINQLLAEVDDAYIEDQHRVVYEESISGETERSEWFKYLETELGLEESTTKND